MRDSRKPQLAFRLSADQLHAVLRADHIQDQAVRYLGADWAEAGGDADIIQAADKLADAIHTQDVDELDAAVDRFEDAAGMGHAETEVSLADALRLRDELDQVIARLARFNPAAALPAQVRRAA